VYRGVLILVVLMLTACTSGKEFARPVPDSLALGHVTRAEIMAAYGKPYRETTRVVTASENLGATGATSAVLSDAPALTPGATATSGTLTTLIYSFVDRTENFLIGSPPKQKVIAFEFANNKLFAYNFVSDFEADSSNFDEARIAHLERGKTSKGDAAALFGTPTGRSVFPAVRPGDEKFVYQYFGKSRRQLSVKRLELVFADDDRLRDFTLVNDVGPAPAPTGGSAPVPIFIPRR
jgi:hypothetical protein